MADVTLKQMTFRGWQHCMQLSNGAVDLIVTADVGPRIARYGFVDGDNMLCEVHGEDGPTDCCHLDLPDVGRRR
jgi:hypothetical protein